MEYKITAPKYFIGDTVSFIDHNGKEWIGTITFVQTDYKKEIIKGEKEWKYSGIILPCHIYSILKKHQKQGYKRNFLYSEEKIIKLIKKGS